jgi:hypothetical protein
MMQTFFTSHDFKPWAMLAIDMLASPIATKTKARSAPDGVGVAGAGTG